MSKILELVQSDNISHHNSSEGNNRLISRDNSDDLYDDIENTSRSSNSDEETRRSNISVTNSLEDSEFNDERSINFNSVLHLITLVFTIIGGFIF